jgi:5-methyltetrahydropteroyltriglutamate--homocysteine methyltransferase
VSIPTEPIGSLPRPEYLLTAMTDFAAGGIDRAALDARYDQAISETIERLSAVGSPVVTDGEQAKPSFATYPLSEPDNLAPDGVVIPFADGHTRQLPKLTAGPFRYGTYAVSYLDRARKLTDRPVKQAVIAPSALSLLYPGDGIEGYAQDQFLADLADEAESDIRRCLDAGADSVQLDFTEGRLSIKLDPSKGVLRSFIDINNSVLERFSDTERARIGVHTCPGGDLDSVHSADIDYADLLPDLFRLRAGRFYLQLASEADRRQVLSIIREHSQDDQKIFIGVIDPINPRVETAAEVRDAVIEAAEYIPVARLGTCDDCGFSPFADDVSTSRDTAFAKIAARVEGTRLAAEHLGA